MWPVALHGSSVALPCLEAQWRLVRLHHEPFVKVLAFPLGVRVEVDADHKVD